jgi:NAD(P)H-dependent FMN reductase
MVTVLGICGSLREHSHTRILVKEALAAAARCGARTAILDLRELPLPLFDPDVSYESHPHVVHLLQAVREADCYIVGTPEYHGCMSGGLKNLFDYVYTEISGKLFGICAATGGSQGVSSLDNLRACLLYCHAWVLPYNVGAYQKDFDEKGNIINDQVKDRLMRLGRDVAIYGPLLYEQFRRDLLAGQGEMRGFAEWTQ